LPEDLRERAAAYARDELFDSLLYRGMAKREKGENRKVLEEMARQEEWHYKFWSKYSGPVELSAADRLRLRLYLLASRILGKVFTVKFLERHEEGVIAEYREMLERGLIPEEDREILKRIIRDEEEHEDALAGQIDEFAVRHLGSIALGMADAIIELTGVHAGFLGFTASTILTGIAGLIVGVSAAMSMSAASYLQAKQEHGKEPLVSAAATGIAYILTVLALTAPFFTLPSLLEAFAVSVVLALAILAFFSYYSSVVFDRAFLRDYLENAGLILVVVAVSYYFGEFVHRVFGNVPL